MVEINPEVKKKLLTYARTAIEGNKPVEQTINELINFAIAFAKDEIKDRRIRLQYYLKQTKEALKYKNYKVAYSNLYSFSSKLRNLAKSHVQKKYADLAKIIMDKDNIPHAEFSKIISELLVMPDNIDDYLN